MLDAFKKKEEKKKAKEKAGGNGRVEQHHTQQQPQHAQKQPQQQHGQFEQHHITEQHRSGEHQPLRQNVNIDRQAFQAQQPMVRRRCDETHLQESHPLGLRHEEHSKLSKKKPPSDTQTLIPLVTPEFRDFLQSLGPATITSAAQAFKPNTLHPPEPRENKENLSAYAVYQNKVKGVGSYKDPEALEDGNAGNVTIGHNGSFNQGNLQLSESSPEPSQEANEMAAALINTIVAARTSTKKTNQSALQSMQSSSSDSSPEVHRREPVLLQKRPVISNVSKTPSKKQEVQTQNNENPKRKKKLSLVEPPVSDPVQDSPSEKKRKRTPRVLANDNQPRKRVRGRFKCKICGKIMLSRLGLEGHSRAIHTGERPFKCGHCGRGFARRSGLRSHDLERVCRKD